MKTQRCRRGTSRLAGAAFVWALAMAPAMLAPASAVAQTFKALYSFTGGADGGGPWGTPLLYGGNLYGTTYYGGGPSSTQSGTVFEFNPSTGTETTPYVFLGQPFDGSAPMSGLVADPYGDLYGTTTEGGFSLRGTVFEISGGSEFVLVNFSGNNGETPEGNLIIDPLGDLYGTTTDGGANDSGSVFAFSAGGSLITLYSFGNYLTDAIGPASGLLLEKGILYGVTTEGGAHGWGTVFSVDPKTKQETILYSFQGTSMGGTPVGGLAADKKGNLYGTASVGGNANGNSGDGVVFKFNIASLQYSLVHTFKGSDGADPLGTLIGDGMGNFYGTTFAGGAAGFGTVFEFNSHGFTTLYSFSNGDDGAYPYAGLTVDSSGNLYGTATRGGQYDWGTLFEITP